MTEFSNFLADEGGAITVDWVALTAGVLIVGIVVVFAIYNRGVGPAAKEVNATLSAMTLEASKGTGVDCNNFNSC